MTILVGCSGWSYDDWVAAFEITRFTGLGTEEVCYALGWLGREGKLAATKQEGRIIKFSLI